MRHFLYTIGTTKSYEAAVEAVEAKVAEKGYRVMRSYDVAAILASEGFARGPLKIVEVCSAKYADEALSASGNCFFAVSKVLRCPG